MKTPCILGRVVGVLMGFSYNYVAQAIGQIDPGTNNIGSRQVRPLHGHCAVQRRAVAFYFLWLEEHPDDQALYGPSGAFWGVFIWKEFKGAPKGANSLLLAMFLFYLIGLAVLILSKLNS